MQPFTMLEEQAAQEALAERVVQAVPVEPVEQAEQAAQVVLGAQVEPA